MNTKSVAVQIKTAITAEDWKRHYLGHRALTRKVLEAFPEKEFFSFSIGGMRTPVEIAAELIAITYPGIEEFITGKTAALNEKLDLENSKEKVLQLWDESSEKIADSWDKISEERFREDIVSFGQYPGKVWSNLAYYIDNEIHHRGQLYVYLRALGIEPPAFYDRSPYND